MRVTARYAGTMGLGLLRDRVRQARRHNAEQRLAGLLRHRRLRGHEFRRHHTVGPFVVDYLCIEHALILELTDGQHALGLPADSNRRALLESLGFTVLRLWDSEVLSDPKAVLAKIVAALGKRAH
jgi:very-short-patch-repair endonuclease